MPLQVRGRNRGSGPRSLRRDGTSWSSPTLYFAKVLRSLVDIVSVAAVRRNNFFVVMIIVIAAGRLSIIYMYR